MQATLRRHFTLDRQALELAALFAVVLGATVAIAMQFRPETVASVGPPDTFGDGASGEAAASATWVVAEVIWAGILLVGYLGYRRLPEWLQDTVRKGAGVVVLLYVGAAASSFIHIYAALLASLFVGYRVLDHYGLWWMANNLFCVLLAVVVGVVLGMYLGVVGMAVALVGLTIYDHVFANKQRWMFQLAKPILAARLPVLFIRPDEYRFQWSDLLDEDGGLFDEDESEDDGKEASETSWGLGTADLMLPAGFVAAVVTAPAGALYLGGAVAGLLCVLGVLVACARLRFEMLTRGSGAGLPALSAGVLAPYVAASLVAVVLV